MPIQRLENEGLILAARNAADTDYAPLKSKSLYLTDGAPLGDVAAAIAAAGGANATVGKVDRFVAFGDEFEWVVGARSVTISDLLPYNLFVGSTTNSAESRLYVPLRLGTWSFWIMSVRREDAPNLKFKVDGVDAIISHNLYKALPRDYAHIVGVTGITVTAQSLNDLRIVASGNTSPSSGHVLTVTKMWGLRTGA